MCLSLPAGKHYPMYATQFHPEKNNMMWSVKAKLNHTQLAVQMSQYFANFFVAEGMTPLPCITNAIWRYRKTFSQRENCFQQQKRCHWFEGLGQCQIAVWYRFLAAPDSFLNSCATPRYKLLLETKRLRRNGLSSSSLKSSILDSSVGLSAGIQSTGDPVPESLGSNPAYSRGRQLVSFRKSIACATASKLTTTNNMLSVISIWLFICKCWTLMAILNPTPN